MSAAERDFSTFQLGDNVHELAGNLIPEIAELLNINLGNEPNSQALGELVGKIGTNKVLRANAEVTAIDRYMAVHFVNRSGVQVALSRSLWTPEVPVSVKSVDAIVVTGGVANWQDRTAEHVAFGMVQKPVYAAAGNRPMDTATEKTNENVARINRIFKRYPTEGEYVSSVVAPELDSDGFHVLATSYPTRNGDEIADRFFEDNPHLLEQSLVFARVANAGVQLAVQMRKAAQAKDPQFDANPNKPQVFISTDTFPLARTDAEEQNPKEFQKASTALRQVALAAKMLHEAAGGE